MPKFVSVFVCISAVLSVVTTGLVVLNPLVFRVSSPNIDISDKQPKTARVLTYSYKPREFPSCSCDKKPSEGCGFLLPLDQLVSSPTPITGLQDPPCIIQDRWIKPFRLPVFSIILTVWNQETRVAEHIQALLNHTQEPWELIVVFDGCKDNSENVATAFLKSAKLPQDLVHLLLIQQPTPVWETSANNIGMRAATPGVEYFVLVQDDMQMTWKGWNVLLAVPVRLYDDVIAVSGRCAHKLYSPATSPVQQSVGRCGAGVDRPLVASNTTMCTFHVRDTANRGPLLLSASKVIALGFLDEVNFFLGGDEHDLMKRAWFQKNWTAGWMPLDFVAPLDIGGTRSNGTQRSQQESKYLSLRKMRRRGGFIPPAAVRDHSEDRQIPPEFGCLSKPEWWLDAMGVLKQKKMLVTVT